MSNDKHFTIKKKMQCRINAIRCRPTQIIKSNYNHELSVLKNCFDLFISCLIFHDKSKALQRLKLALFFL